MLKLGEARLGTERVKYRIAVDPNHEEVSIFKRLLQIAERLIFISEADVSQTIQQ
jgi:hypothetical protein